MKYYIFSDLHGNEYAMEALLEKINTNEEHGFIFLGDVFGYLYGQEKCIEYLRTLKNSIVLKGNHDQYYLKSVENILLREQYIEKYGTSYEMLLKKENYVFLGKCSTKKEVIIEGKKILCVHGGINDYLEERIYPDQVKEYYRNNKDILDKYDYVLSGHTHYSVDEILSENTRWINPGSLGQPRDGKGFSYVVVDFAENNVEFKSVQCDINKIRKEIENFEVSVKNKEYLLERFKRIDK